MSSPYREKPMKVEYTLTEEELKEAVAEWINRHKASMFEVTPDDVSFDAIADEFEFDDEEPDEVVSYELSSFTASVVHEDL